MVRHKNRYMLITIKLDKSSKLPELDTYKLRIAIMNRVQQLFGDFGVAAVTQGFNVSYCNKLTRTAIVRARHGPHKLVAAATSGLHKINDKDRVCVHTLYMGATLRQCYKFLLRYQHMRFQEMAVNFKTEEARAELFKSLQCKGIASSAVIS